MKKLVAIAVLLMLLAPAALPSSSPQDKDALKLLNSGRVTDAIELLRQVTNRSNTDAEAWHLLSRAYLSLGRWNDAVTAGEKAVTLEPNNSEYHLWLGRAYGEKAEHSIFWVAWGLGKKVRQEFQKAVALNAENVDARSDLAEFYIEAPGILGGGTDKARAEADQIARYDESTAAWVKGRVAEKEGNLDEAEKQYLESVKVSQNQPGALLDLASFYRRTNQLDKMEATVNRAVSIERKKNNVLFDAATLLYRTGRNFPGAANMLRKYLASDSKTEEAPAFQAHYLLGQILEKEGDKKGAEAEYEAALSLAKDFTDAQRGLERVRR
jgi:tetratricopeptide (TPR) repeat protein